MRILFPLLLASMLVACATPSEEMAQPALALRKPVPRYPLFAIDQGIEGVSRIAIQVLADGQVGRVEVQQGSGSPPLDAAAVDAARKMSFRPAQAKSGRGMESWVVVPYRFKLE